MSDTSEDVDREAIKEQYSEKIAAARRKHGYTGGSLVVKMQQDDGSGRKYGPYAYHQAPPSADRKWTYLGTVNGGAQSEGKTSGGSVDEARNALPEDLPEYAEDLDHIHEILDTFDDYELIEIDGAASPIKLVGENGRARATIAVRDGSLYASLGRSDGKPERLNSVEEEEVLSMLAGYPDNADIGIDTSSSLYITTENEEFEVTTWNRKGINRDISVGDGEFESIEEFREVRDEFLAWEDAAASYDEETVNEDSLGQGIALHDPTNPATGDDERIVVEVDYEDKEDVKDLDWDVVEPRWSGSEWTIKQTPEAIERATEELSDKGYRVRKAGAVKMVEESDE